MVVFGGKRVAQLAGLGGNGVGQILAAVAAALLFRLFSGPGPAVLPENEVEDDRDEIAGDTEGGEAPIAGKVFPVTIQWSNITCSLSDKSSKSVRFLLKNVSGEAKPGRLLAIMGPSGSGKTTLLNVLAGQLMVSPRLHLSGLLEVNGKARSRKLISMSRPLLGLTLSKNYLEMFAYVRQEDLFFSQLTVRETLSLAAELQLPELSSVEDRDEYVNNLLYKLVYFIIDFASSKLGSFYLVSCADSNVGDAKVRGISGGEKKRLSLACELIASPSVIFADEPTTGLDAFQAEKVMETLRLLAQDGHTVICSIHQPRSSVYHCPDHVNPAEFLADLISIDYSSADSVYSSQKRIDGLVESFSQQTSAVLYATPLTRRESFKSTRKFSEKAVVKKKGVWWRQFWLLLRRAWMQASRDGPTNKVRSRMSIASAIIFGSVFWRMGRSQTSIQDRMGLLQINPPWGIIDLQYGNQCPTSGLVAAINTAMAALTKTVAEIPVGAAFPLMFGAVLYPWLVFILLCSMESFAASAMGLTVGAMVPTPEAAMAVGPSLMTVFIVFGGYYVNAENTPIIFRWIPRISLIRWAFQGLCINEFSGLEFDHQQPFDIQTGEQALERLSFGGSRIRDTVMAQSRILLFWYFTTYRLLERNKPKYQQLEPPSPDQVQPPLQLEPSDTDQAKPNQQLEPPLAQVESTQKLESPPLDQIQPFILEGAK
ncbi:ABC transporter G family member 7 [Vitis vinifera]|uniref:ABC transporter G family member 7 n=1 Tax=Vitis vinifera TaxID=29760 RepID=A0A438JUP5_VITVI|nr:ABC transporter G family member 7 [Vitis vinifera]